jgi:hypothetical protein
MKVIGGCMLALVLATGSAPGWAFILIKSEEAKLPPASGVLTTRGITRGPGVRLLSPEPAVTVNSPFSLKIVFEPRGGSKIDMAAVRITYLKATPIDLLPRVKPGLSGHGIALEGAEVPPGEHAIQLSVQDSEGRVTNTVFQINVAR